MERDLNQLSTPEAQSLLLERIKSLLEVSPDKAKTYSEKLYGHYKKLDCFPKSTGTLDASIKALIKVWDKSPQMTP